MGARIAAHIANAGVPVLLLDMAPASGDADALGTQALLILRSAKPAAFVSAAAAGLVSVGNFKDDLAKLKQCDWVIEAVAENLEIKQDLLSRVAPHLSDHAILTTNTSGLPVAKIAEQLPPEIRRRWFGTHFFNPPRYMRLLELIATPESDPEAIATIAAFVDRQLGKTVVPANDVQNFIANRVGTFSILNILRIMQEQGLTIEEVDLLTGELIGWPNTGTFRLTDMVGLDVLGSVARNFAAGVSDERSDVVLPEVVVQLIERKWLGDKTGQGFYKKERGPRGEDLRSVLDLKTLEYRPATKVSIAEAEKAKSVEPLALRLRSLLAGDPARDRAARFYWQLLPELWTYAANRIGEVTETLVDIDLAMTAGFNWKLGPFALWDAVGVPFVIEKMRARGSLIPAAAEALLESGGTSWFRNGGTEYFDVPLRAYRPVPRSPELATVATYRRTNSIFAGNSGISLIDLGEGIGCFELHSKMNTLGGEVTSFLRNALQPDSDAVRNFSGFVISTDAQNFSVGANLMELLFAVQEGRWDQVQQSVRHFQDMTQAVKLCPRPVIAAVAGLCLGGGCEISLHSALRQAHLELYCGLVETGVGLIPGGGGCKEMLLRATADAARVRPDTRGDSAEVGETIRRAFETIALAKVSTSAVDARDLGLLDELDTITMNRARLLHDAKLQALRLAHAGYTAPACRTDLRAPGASVLATLKLNLYLMREAEYISEHDATIATHLARILTGGDITPGTLISEQYLLDLEREAFLSLCGEPKTVERILFTLKTGKPLRN